MTSSQKKSVDSVSGKGSTVSHKGTKLQQFNTKAKKTKGIKSLAASKLSGTIKVGTSTNGKQSLQAQSIQQLILSQGASMGLVMMNTGSMYDDATSNGSQKRNNSKAKTVTDQYLLSTSKKDNLVSQNLKNP